MQCNGFQREGSVRFFALGAMLTFALGLLVTPLATDAQPLAKVPHIGYLSTGGQVPCTPRFFLQALHDLGYVEGQTISLTERCAAGKTDVARQFAEELVQLRVDVIVSLGLAGSLAAKAATRTIPIIFMGVGDPVAPGLVPSLAHPGGNVTGVTNIAGLEFFAKHLELLREVVPTITHVALLLSAGDPFNAYRIQLVETAARAVGITLHLVEAEVPHGFEAAFATMTRQGVGAILVSFTPSLGPHRGQIAALAATHRLPAIEQNRTFAEQGGLMSYGERAGDLSRRAASYVDRILKGTKPADLPVELPTKYEFVINLKTAQAFGLTIPPTLLFLADEVIR